jgi:hypothetical protein
MQQNQALKIDHFPLKYSPMQLTGSALKRAIQNNNLNLLDLLVRESIQNSLDAAIDKKEDHCVSMEFKIEKQGNFFENLPHIGSHLKKLNLNDCKMLSIIDSGTTGLSEPFSMMVDSAQFSSNFCKLVYEIAKPQKQEGSGGSWGIGKTIYYQIGIGLVLYYTKIYNQESKKTKEALAICLVENEENLDEIRISTTKTGVDWWGKTMSTNEGTQYSMAITDQNEITKIFQELGINRPKHQGSMICIPYLKNHLISNQSFDSTHHFDQFTISDDIQNQYEMYLAKSIQKWYAVRLDFRYPRGYLQYEITNSLKSCVMSSTDGIFRYISELYYQTTGGIHPIKINSCFQKNDKDGTTIVGSLKYKYIKKSDLDQENINLDASLGIKPEDLNRPIFSFLRKPGMFISWDAVGEWIGSIEIEQKNQEETSYFLGIFVPNSDLLFNDDFQKKLNCKTFEDYLRKIEKSDHHSWQDEYPHDIIKRIQNNIKKFIKSQQDDKKNQLVRSELMISQGSVLGELLWPSSNNGLGGSPPKKNKQQENGTNVSQSSPSFEIKSKKFDHNQKELEIKIELIFINENHPHILELMLTSETTSIDYHSWNKDFPNQPFPFCFQENKDLELDANRIQVKIKPDNKNKKTKTMTMKILFKENDFSLQPKLSFYEEKN